MKRFVLFVFGLICQTIFAAECEETNIRGMSFRMQKINVQDLNLYNKKFQMPEIENTFADINMSTIFSRSKKNKFVTEMEGYVITSEVGVNKNYLSKIWGVAVTISIGYEIYRVGCIGITPHIGAGFGKMQWSILNRQFENVDGICMEKQKTEGNIGTGIMLEREDKKIFVGVEGDIQPFKDNKFTLLIDAGYDFSIINGKWKINGIEVDGGPRLNSSGVFFRIGCGF